MNTTFYVHSYLVILLTTVTKLHFYTCKLPLKDFVVHFQKSVNETECLDPYAENWAKA